MIKKITQKEIHEAMMKLAKTGEPAELLPPPGKGRAYSIKIDSAIKYVILDTN